MAFHVKGNRWCIFGATWFINLFTSATAIFSVLSKPMTGLHTWNMADFSLAYTLYMLTFCGAGIFTGRLSDRYGPQKILYAGALCFGAGWFLTGVVDSIGGLYFAYGIMAGLGAGAAYNACVSATLKWFPDKGGSISGYIMSAAALGPFLFAPIANFTLEMIGVQAACRLFGVIFIVCICLVSWMVQGAPAGYKPAGWHAKPNMPAASSVDCDWRHMVRMPVFYLLFIMFVLANVSGTMLVGSVSVIVQEQVLASAARGAQCVSLFMLMNLCGRLAFGVLYDRMGGIKSLMLAMIMNMAGMLLLTQANSLPVFIAALVVVGFSFGGQLVAFAPLVKQFFGSLNFGQNYGIMFFAYAVGAFIGPRLSAYFRDATGHFTSAFLWAAVCAAIAMALLMLTARILNGRVVEEAAVSPQLPETPEA